MPTIPDINMAAMKIQKAVEDGEVGGEELGVEWKSPEDFMNGTEPDNIEGEITEGNGIEMEEGDEQTEPQEERLRIERTRPGTE